MLLSELIEPSNAGGVFPQAEVSGLALDSREVKKGFLFFAVHGAHTDGNSHIAEALARGAAAAVTEDDKAGAVRVKDIRAAMALAANRFYKVPSSRLETIGITGTNGKTTTAYLLEAIYSLAGRKPGVIGTISYRTGAKKALAAPNTTPNAILLNRLLSEMAQNGCRSAVMEVSSHSLAEKRADGTLFDCAVFLNLNQDHLDFHLTKENYFRAKLRLFEMLASDGNPKPDKCAVINSDDEWAEKIPQVLGGKARVITFGLKSGDFRAEDIRPSLSGVEFTLAAPRLKKVSLKLFGAHNVYNALAALACAEARGIPLETAISGVESVEAVPGRMEAVREGQDFYVFVDFAHTESALKAALGSLSAFPHGKIYTVFGCGGERDNGKRGPMGVAACSASSHVFITADNPRREKLSGIFADIEAGIKSAGFSNYTVLEDRREAIFSAVKAARKGDIVLLAGKGHETTQLLNGGTIHFSDAETAREAIKNV